MSGLSLRELRTQLLEYELELSYFGKSFEGPEHIVIRTETGDRGIAACHVEDGTLVIDMGKEER